MPRYRLINKNKINGYLTSENTEIALTVTPATITTGVTIENNVGFTYADGIFTASKTGYYMFLGDANFKNSTNAVVTFGLYKNDQLVAGAATPVTCAVATDYGQVSINRTQLLLNIGDTIRVKVNASAGTPTLTVYSYNISLTEI